MAYKDKQKAKEYHDRYRRDNPKQRSAYHEKYRNSCFYVYTHTNTKGDLYIGSGHKYRPNQKSKARRSSNWWEAFKDGCEVNIIAEFKDKTTARELERLIIEEVGLSNLVNKRK